MLNLNRLAWLKAGAPPRNVAEAAFRARFAGGASYEKTVGPAPIISISDAKAKPAKSLIVGMEPIQDLHGYDSPWPAGGGINKWGEGDQSFTGVAYLDLAHPIPAGSYCVSAVVTSTDTDGSTCLVSFRTADATSLASLQLQRSTGGSRVSGVITVSDTVGKVYLYSSNSAASSSGDSATFKDIQIEDSVSPTDFAPYSNICPISGRTSMTAYRTGKNLFNTAETGWILGIINDNGEPVLNVNLHYTDNFTAVSGGATYTLSGTLIVDNIAVRVYYYDVGKNWISRSGSFLSQSVTFTTPANCAFIRIHCASAITSTTDWQIELGSTASDYSAYSGATYPVVFPDSVGTVYGGTVDLVSGLLTVTHGMYVFSGEESWQASLTPNRFYINSFNIYLTDKMASQPMVANATQNVISSVVGEFIYKNADGVGYIVTAGGDEGRQLVVNTTAATTTSEINAIFTGTQLCYELATPQTYQLTPQQIELLKGSNVLWSDADELTLTYIGTQPAGLLGGGLGGSWTPPADEPEEEGPVPEEEQAEESDPEEVIPDGE